MSRIKYQECKQCGESMWTCGCGDGCGDSRDNSGDAIDQAMAAMEIKQEMQSMQEECYQLLKTS